ncbi:hypothetical protein C4K88_01845 [Arthrobacter pityocampae]|uniref:Uncharacterized protein n=1 Tax=Arthrobacter pityocampae TaxID=547334 RepID=A0A2S5J1N1_9MICC|nr:hypothetical protein C4K88_01845 [Arthrobacter pityocampae]
MSSRGASTSRLRPPALPASTDPGPPGPLPGPFYRPLPRPRPGPLPGPPTVPGQDCAPDGVVRRGRSSSGRRSG